MGNTAAELFSEIAKKTKELNIEIPKDSDSFTVLQCKWYNANEGNLQGCDCRKCKNKGNIAVIVDGVMVHKECECMPLRQSMIRINSSGLGGLINRYTFESYKVSEEWQERAKNKALKYASKPRSEDWLFIGGISGCGKTHLCTAVCDVLMQKGLSVKYEIWRELLRKLRAIQFKDDEFQARMQELKTADVLYIDDFLKSTDAKQLNSDANYILEIINARYNGNKKTVISSELLIEDIMAIDRSLAGRIYEKAKGYTIQIKPDKARDYRFNGQKM